MRSELLTTMLILLIVASLTAWIDSSSAGTVDVPHPLVLKYEFNFTIIDVLVLNTTHVVLVVNYGDHSAVVVVSLEDPVGGPRVVQSYPMAGRVTATAVDGYPSTRFAVGSDRGEVYLFRIDGGRLYELLHLVQGADFRVIALFIARAAGGYKLIATVSEGTPTSPCFNCYVYAFDENLLGAFIVSPHAVAAAAGYYKRVYPQIAVPARVYTPGGYYYRADAVALFWAPYIDAVIAEVVLSQLVNATASEPAARALIEVSLLDPVAKVRRVYGWNADTGGRALIPIPRGYLANVTAIGSTRRFLLRANVNTSAIARRFRIEAVIGERASTELAEEVYGPPFFAKYYIDVLDVTNAPASYRVVKSLEKEFYPTVSRPHFVDYRGGYLLAMINRTSLEVYNLDYAFSPRPSTPVALEYLGAAPVSIVDVIAHSKDDLVVGLSDGRVKHYRFNAFRDRYEFAQGIVTLGSLVRILPLTEYSYFTFSTRGVQVIVLTPFQLPILRTGTRAEFSVEGLVSASSLPGAGLIALATPSELYAVINLEPAIAKSIPVDLDRYVAPSLIVRVLPPSAQERINGSRVTLRYEIGGRMREVTKTLVGDSVTFTNIVPGLRYWITVVPPRDYILDYTATVDFPYCEESCRSIVMLAVLGYRDFNFRLVLRDEFGGPPLGRLRVFVGGSVYSYEAPEGLNVRLLYGQHEIRIESIDGYYPVHTVQVKVETDAVLALTLRRSRYDLTLLFIDGLTRRAADPRLIVYINGTTYSPDPHSTLSVTVPSGATNITVVPSAEVSRVYRRHSMVVVVNRSAAVEVLIEREEYSLTVSAIDDLTNLEIPVEASVYINGTEAYRGPLPKSLSLPYAYYSIEVRPIGAYAATFSSGTAELALDSNRAVPVRLFRRVYVLDIVFRDRYSERPVVPLRVLLNGTPYSTLMAPRLSLPLRAAIYVIRVEPIEEHRDSYAPVERVLSLKSDSELVVELERRNYTLNLKLVDTSVRGYLEGRFRVSLNATVSLVVEGFEAFRGINISVPYGRYVLTVVPVDASERIYAAPSPATIDVFSGVSYTVRLSRRTYTLTAIVVNDLEERVANAYIRVIDPKTELELSLAYTNEYGEVRLSLPAGAVLVGVSKVGYHEYTATAQLDRDLVLTLRLSPTLVTLISRFTHVIALSIVAVAAIVIALKVRAKLAGRLATAEEVF